MGEFQLKQCTKCGESKALAEFHRDRTTRDGYRPQCKLCTAPIRARSLEKARQNRGRRVEQIRQIREDRRTYSLSLWYGITREQHAALLAFQGFACAGCGVAEGSDRRALAVDHDHSCCPYPEDGSRTLRGCGQCVRGLLCSRCNGADVLAGARPVDWTSVMGAARAGEAGS